MTTATLAAPLSGALRGPITREHHRLLRQAALEHHQAERGRRILPVLRAGAPGPQQATLPLHDVVIDLALATDVVEAMWRRMRVHVPEPLLWLTRGGDLTPGDLDYAWARAVGCAEAELGVPLTFVVVVRHAWRDPRSGVSRRWTRLR